MIFRFAGPVVATALFAAFAAASPTQAQAQAQKLEKLPAYHDFIVDIQPDGFVHAHEQGALNRFIIEYIPKGDSLEQWHRMLSIIALGSAKVLPDADRYAALFFKQIESACEKLDVAKLSAPAGEARYRVACDPIAAGQSIPGGNGLRWELGVYRFVKTGEALYQIHYVEHGKEVPSQSRREQIYAEAAAAVGNVLICRLDAAAPCPPLDSYVLDGEAQPVSGEPPCRSNDAAPCNPAVVYGIPAAAGLPTDPSAKKALLTVDFSAEDLSLPDTLSRYAGAIINRLRSGSPEVTMLIRGPSPDYRVTAEDRVRVGTFLMVMRSVLIRQGVVDPNLQRFAFYNFR